MFIKVENQKDVFKITLNRPDLRNAFHPEMIQQLTGAFREAAQSKARFVYLSGAGKSFCAGADLDWMKSMKNFSRDQNIADSEKLYEMFQAAWECELPILTQVQGHVMGGAIGLVAVSDFVAAHTETQFCFSEVKLGLAPAVISSFVLSKTVHPKIKEWMLSGKIFSSQDAKDVGLVSFYGEEIGIKEFLLSTAQSLCSAGPEAVRKTKKMLRGLSPEKLEFKRLTTETIADRRVSAEGQEGLTAFFEKRQPSWKKDFHGTF